MTQFPILIGTAGWAYRKEQAQLFLTEGSHLEKYAEVYNAVEINSSFHREHMGKSYKRWAASVPSYFRFSVKLSKIYTHEHKLKKVDDNLKMTLDNIMQLGSNFGVLIVQLPASLKFDFATAEKFFSTLAKCFPAPIVIEPRHLSWTTVQAIELIHHFHISIVHADPDLIRLPVGFSQTVNYFRLHGSPQIYKSSYEEGFLNEIFHKLSDLQNRHTQQNWVVFDNTAYGYANQNAIRMQEICGCRKSIDLNY